MKSAGLAVPCHGSMHRKSAFSACGLDQMPRSRNPSHDTSMRRGARRAVAHRLADQPVHDDGVRVEQRRIERQEIAHDRRGSGSRLISPASSRRIGAGSACSNSRMMRRLVDVVGERPAERRMRADRCRQHRVAGVGDGVASLPANRRSARSRWRSGSRTGRSPASARRRAAPAGSWWRCAIPRRSGASRAKPWRVHRIGVPGHLQPIVAQLPNDREQHRRMPRPLRPCLPQHLLPAAIFQRA